MTDRPLRRFFYAVKSGIGFILTCRWLKNIWFSQGKAALKKCNYSASEVSISLDRYELAKEIKDLALKNCDIEPTVENIKRFLSIYASENPAEFVAEAIACNINNIACKNSDKVVEYFLKGVV